MSGPGPAEPEGPEWPALDPGAGEAGEPTPPQGSAVVIVQPGDRDPRPGEAAEPGAGPDDAGPDGTEAEDDGAGHGEDAGDPGAGPVVPGGPRARRRRRAPAWVRAVALLVAALLVLLVAVIAWYEVEAHPFGGPGHKVVVDISKGESTDAVLSALAQDGVIGSSLAMRLSFIVHGTPRILPGAYLFHQNSSFSSVHQLLADGPNVFTVTVFPGFTLQEVARAVDQVPGHSGPAFLTVARSGAVPSPFEPPGVNNLEGLLGTGIYQVLPGESDRQLLEAMVARFDTDAAQAGLTTASAAALGLTPYQVVTVASVVQKEGYIEKNMGPVARVIYNRLAKGTPLQMDSTVLYSLGQDGGKVTPADLKVNTPYNSYLHTGLPPTPICFPSPQALYAAVHPPPGTWLYFVVVEKDGTEAFSSTFADQLANEKLAQSRGVG